MIIFFWSLSKRVKFMFYPFFINRLKMKYIKKKKAVLLLEDGTIFYGKANGVEGIAVGLSTKILPHNFTELIKSCISILSKISPW